MAVPGEKRWQDKDTARSCPELVRNCMRKCSLASPGTHGFDLYLCPDLELQKSWVGSVVGSHLSPLGLAIEGSRTKKSFLVAVIIQPR